MTNQPFNIDERIHKIIDECERFDVRSEAHIWQLLRDALDHVETGYIVCEIGDIDGMDPKLTYTGDVMTRHIIRQKRQELGL